MSEQQEKTKTETEESKETLQASPTEVNQARTISLFGDLDEDAVENICLGLLALKESPNKEPIELYISTWGGDALGMFAIYDLMRMVKKECEIHTFAFGKVMSAGVLLLATGTKGKRKIGKNTRVMIHSIRGGHYGPVHILENEIAETRWIQAQHIDVFAKETKITRRELKKMLNKKVDLYFNAEEAVKYGIADIIV